MKELRELAPGNEDNHYVGEVQPIDYIVSNGLDAITANILKYVARYKRKRGLEDLKKAKWYLGWLKKIESGDIPNPITMDEFCDAQEFSPDQCELLWAIENFNEHGYYFASMNLLDVMENAIGNMIKDYE